MNTNFQKRKNYFPRFVKNPFRDESQSLVYNSFRISTGRPPAYNELAIQYGNHRERISQQYSDWQHTIDKLWEGACEYITHNGQTTTLTYLNSPDGLYALHHILPDGSENIHYIHTDHLGSWTAVTDETGTIVDEQSYDAWGNRRNPYTWRKTGLWQTPRYDRGFTGHEHLDGFQLINMNGRMYDPVVSRMLAPDNFVQTPDFSQNFNRYSYALNNPLMYTDPSGEFIVEAMLIGAFINAAIQTATGNVNNVGDFFMAAGIGALSGAAGAGVGVGVQTASAGASFWAGFLGSSEGISTILSVGYKSSFIAGLTAGGAGGVAGGFTNGFGNGILQNDSFGDAIESGIKSGIIGGVGGAFIGGVIGGIDAVYGNPNHQRNFWSGNEIARGRRPFAFNNTDRAFNVYQTPSGYEPRSYYEGILDGTKNKTYHEYVRYGDAPPSQISNGSISRIKNYLMPEEKIRNYRIDKFIGRSDLMVLDQASHEVVIRVNGQIVSPTNGYIPLWEGSESLSIQIINTNSSSGGVLSPYKFKIIGYIKR